ncbi:26S proteasome non-ATPase regulatory subunit 11 [Niveomyces insectorum RCEF 264]|uniref:Required for respiratory growth protein 9, mitochondrial n=1 Tax=Niveomyces insectorum RCEF 264 TaxID=1081102 RepID=A0A167Z7W2_9HYPO|nr:26S proteasome non-ATPase regulatory subunit 11 [Niveomyces insectorum RCEF 264]
MDKPEPSKLGKNARKRLRRQKEEAEAKAAAAAAAAAEAATEAAGDGSAAASEPTTNSGVLTKKRRRTRKEEEKPMPGGTRVRPRTKEQPEQSNTETGAEMPVETERRTASSSLTAATATATMTATVAAKKPARTPAQRDPPFVENNAKAEPWQTQKRALQAKFPAGWQPRKRLSPDALDGIRALHRQFPDVYTTPVLADHFRISPEAIRRILKSKWQASPEEEEDRQARWFDRGKHVWARWAALGKKPPKRWQAEGILRDPSWAGGRRQRQQRQLRQMEIAQEMGPQPPPAVAAVAAGGAGAKWQRWPAEQQVTQRDGSGSQGGLDAPSDRIEPRTTAETAVRPGSQSQGRRERLFRAQQKRERTTSVF